MDRYYDQPEEFYCENCQEQFPNDEWNDGYCEQCYQTRVEDGYYDED